MLAVDCLQDERLEVPEMAVRNPSSSEGHFLVGDARS
jgi:hypothetical protein